MKLSAAIELIKNEHLTPQYPGTWADLGCGSGLFTYALANLLAPGSTVHAVDKAPVRLDPSLSAKTVDIKTLQLDFVANELPYSDLDGVLMANSLHYVQDKKALIDRLTNHLKPEGYFLIVEYDTDTPVPQWIPYPISFRKLEVLFTTAGFQNQLHLDEHTSVYGRANMYAALASR